MTGPAAGCRTFQILTVVAAGMACLLALLPAAGHDQMWLLYAARLHMHGATLYGPELFELNPPMGIWLSLIPEGISRLVHVADTAMAKLLVLVLALVIPAWCLRLIHPLRGDHDAPVVTRTSAWWLAFAWVSLMLVMPARDFGQRDHLLAILFLPYLAIAAVRAKGLPVPSLEATAAGIAAGVGVCLKPHQALAILAVEIFLLTSRLTRRRAISSRAAPLIRPELLALLATGLIFVAAVRVFAPLYLTQVLPVARDTYWAFHQPRFALLVSEAAQLHVLILANIALALTLRRIPGFARVLLAAGAGATAAYYLQGTGWYYQQLPALTFFGLALALLLVQSSREWPRMAKLAWARWLPYAAAALGGLALFLTAHFTDYPFTLARSFPISTPDPSFFANLTPGTPVATLTTTVDYTVPPAFRYHLILGQRYPHLWLLPAILRNEDPQNTGFYNVQPSKAGDASTHLRSAALGIVHPIPPLRLRELDALQHRFMAEDLARWQPRLLLVERCQDFAVHCQVLEDRHDNLLAWFLRDPAFRAQFAHYRYWRSAGSFDAWVRVD